MSSNPSERRAHPDRRQAVRGGRRPQDQPGSTPLVLVVGNGDTPQQEAEAILGKLKFAVALAADVSEALRVIDSLHPDLVVTRPEEASQLRASGLPVIEFSRQGRRVDELADLVLQQVRKQRR